MPIRTATTSFVSLRHAGKDPDAYFKALVHKKSGKNQGLRFQVEFHPEGHHPRRPVPGLYTVTFLDAGGTLYSSKGNATIPPQMEDVPAGSTFDFPSFSYAANAVTGTSTNGPLFWGWAASQGLGKTGGGVQVLSNGRAPLRGAQGPKKPILNTTAQWLNEHLSRKDGKLMRVVMQAIASKCPISSSTSQVEDHAQEFFVRLIRRDSLRKRLSEGGPVTYTHIASYAVRSAFTDARNAGTEPICRELFGARTETERRKIQGVVESDVMLRHVSGDTTTVTMTHDDHDNPMLGDVVVHTAMAVEDRLAFEATWEKVETLIRRRRPGSADRDIAILQRRVQGWTAQEISEALGVNRGVVSSSHQNTAEILAPLLESLRADLL